MYAATLHTVRSFTQKGGSACRVAKNCSTKHHNHMHGIASIVMQMLYASPLRMSVTLEKQNKNKKNNRTAAIALYRVLQVACQLQNPNAVS